MYSSLEGSTVLVSDQGLRKVLYQKIVAAYPEGWMSSGQISRDGKCSLCIGERKWGTNISFSERYEEEVGEGANGTRK